MMDLPVSIFNDVLGPVMRGPSSSHTAAAARIGQLARQLAGGKIQKAVVEFTPDGSLATTYHTQGSDIGLAGGLLGLSLSSPELLKSLSLAAQNGLDIQFHIRKYEATHPNTYKLSLTTSDSSSFSLTALSTGGGMIQITEIDGFPAEIYGDYWELLLYLPDTPGDISKQVKNSRIFQDISLENHTIHCRNQDHLIHLKFSQALEEKTIACITRQFNCNKYRYTSPVLPVTSGCRNRILFHTAAELENAFPKPDTQLWEMALKYESQRGNISEDEVWKMAAGILKIMRQAVQNGLQGTFYKNRILQQQSHLMENAAARLLQAPLINKISQYTMAVMETKSAFGTIVAAPTAGSCAAIPGAILGSADCCGFTEEDCIKALLAAGIVGVLIAQRSTFSAEVAGCQAECGSASGMTAAAIVQLMGGSARTALQASSFALQNIFGMVCDPVANRVEVPCLGKNILAATNGFTAANLITAGVNAVLPLDEVIAAMDEVGRSLPAKLRCTALGGLSVTPTSLAIEKQLKNLDE